jgi:hypothetical protein
MIALSPRARGGGYSNSIHYTHSSTVRTLQDIFGLRPYLADAAFAHDLGDLFKTPQITSYSWQANSFQLTLTNTIAGETNVLQASTNLVPSSWVNIKTNVAAGPSLVITDSSASPARRFYRVVGSP